MNWVFEYIYISHTNINILYPESIGDRLISALNSQLLIQNTPFHISPASVRFPQQKVMDSRAVWLGQPILWKTIKCLCSWRCTFLGWRRSVPYFSEHRRKLRNRGTWINVSHQLKYWTFKRWGPLALYCFLLCGLFASENLAVLPSFRALSRSASSESSPLPPSLVARDEWSLRVTPKEALVADQK